MLARGSHNRTCDWGVLSALVDEYQSTTENSLPDDSTLVVHLRLGDNVAQSRNHSEVIAARSRNESIVLPALPDNVRKVTIVGSLGHIKDSDKHAARKRQMSMDYIGAVRRAWMDAGLATDVRMDHEVDADFVYMSHARHFVYGFRGFSAVVAGTVYYRGGTVYHAAAAYDFLSSSSRLTTLTRRQSGFLAGGCAAPWLRASALSGGP